MALTKKKKLYMKQIHSLTRRRPTAFHYFLCKIPIILPIVIWSLPPLPTLDMLSWTKLRRSSDSNYIPNYISVTLDTRKNKKWSSQVGRPGYKKSSWHHIQVSLWGRCHWYRVCHVLQKKRIVTLCNNCVL